MGVGSLLCSSLSSLLFFPSIPSCFAGLSAFAAPRISSNVSNGYTGTVNNTVSLLLRRIPKEETLTAVVSKLLCDVHRTQFEERFHIASTVQNERISERREEIFVSQFHCHSVTLCVSVSASLSRCVSYASGLTTTGARGDNISNIRHTFSLVGSL